ncbi:MAG: alanine--tRNA ligase [Dehalococcoidia bacterium]|nr:alanine--tRNA ligase [Dehalococcoidia bacterium]
MPDQPNAPGFTVDEVRTMWVDYFQSKGHQPIPSSSLIPAGDPTLLLTTAGMVQFVPYFLGRAEPPARRMTSVQKCFRTTDIDEVGDYKHCTFFEMLGNFSVGDYFKREAIAFAWELLIQKLRLDPKRLYITVYLDDDEAYKFWHEEQKVPREQIVRYGKRANWWGPPGAQGPCGPCSEIHYDFGAEFGCGPMATPAQIEAWERSGNQGEQPGCHPNCDRCARFMEIWNLVFMQFFQDLDKKLSSLPKPNIDTGMGLERIVTVLQGKRTVYDTDIFQPLLARVSELSGKLYRTETDEGFAMRVVAEHARGCTFLIADGVVPGNEGRGYVLRRMIRRAVRYGRKLGLTGPFLSKVSELAIERMGHAYGELRETRDFILRVLQLEEERFQATVVRGSDFVEGYIAGLLLLSDEKLTEIRSVLSPTLTVSTSKITVLPQETRRILFSLNEYIGKARNKVEREPQRAMAFEDAYMSACSHLIQILHGLEEVSGVLANRGAPNELMSWEITANPDDVKREFSRLVKESRQIPGVRAFELYDTYGFPPEVTEEIAKEHGLTVDMLGFEREMESQRQRARGATRMGGGIKREASAYEGLSIGATRFLGYETLEATSVILAIIANGEAIAAAAQDQEIEVILRETPFYAEKGGQVGDQGRITSQSGVFDVKDTQSPALGIYVHKGIVLQGELRVGDTVNALVHPARRTDTARNHTATHMLHAALREVLGTHVRQAGSYVGPDRLRFDFSHVTALTPDEMRKVEALVNEKIREDLPVFKRESTYTQAVKEGALAFFGETYGATVRVIEVGSCSQESRQEHEHHHQGHEHEGQACFSMEVCGGTHLERSGQIGLCLIVGESSVGAGMRRIEAITGRTAESLARERMRTLDQVAQSLATTPADLATRIAALQQELAAEREARATLERSLLRSEVDQALTKAPGGNAVAIRLEHATSADTLREAADWVKNARGSAVVALGAVFNDQPTIFVAVTPDLVKAGVHAGRIAKELGAVMGAGGGGRPESAQAGGKDKAKLDEALRLLPKLLEAKK